MPTLTTYVQFYYPQSPCKKPNRNQQNVQFRHLHVRVQEAEGFWTTKHVARVELPGSWIFRRKDILDNVWNEEWYWWKRSDFPINGEGIVGAAHEQRDVSKLVSLSFRDWKMTPQQILTYIHYLPFGNASQWFYQSSSAGMDRILLNWVMWGSHYANVSRAVCQTRQWWLVVSSHRTD